MENERPRPDAAATPRPRSAPFEEVMVEYLSDPDTAVKFLHAVRRDDECDAQDVQDVQDYIARAHGPAWRTKLGLDEEPE